MDDKIVSSPSSSPFGDDATSLYAQYMAEIKLRSVGITGFLEQANKGAASDGAYIHAECAFLQMRFVCELVALACLAAHHSIGLGTKLSEKWHAAEAMSLLEKLNPECFPVAIVPQSNDLPKLDFHFFVRDDCLKKADFAAIYGRCGDALHRGTIKAHMAGRGKQYDLISLNEWHRRVMDLLDRHMLLVRDPDRVIVVNMLGMGVRPEIHVAVAVEPSELGVEG